MSKDSCWYRAAAISVRGFVMRNKPVIFTFSKRQSSSRLLLTVVMRLLINTRCHISFNDIRNVPNNPTRIPWTAMERSGGANREKRIWDTLINSMATGTFRWTYCPFAVSSLWKRSRSHSKVAHYMNRYNEHVYAGRATLNDVQMARNDRLLIEHMMPLNSEPTALKSIISFFGSHIPRASRIRSG